MSAERSLLILGAGQYGQVAKEVAESTKRFDRIDFLDDNSELAVAKLDAYESLVDRYKYAFVAIGNANLRLSYIQKLEKVNFEAAILISPKAHVSASAQLMPGCIVEPMAVINANSVIGKGVIVCAGAIVNHNAVVGEGCQLDCGSVVGSNVKLNSNTKLKYNEVFDKNTEENV